MRFKKELSLSLVIPCYNEEKLIANNFWHILNQSILPEEVIFVDNNSTDNSESVAESFRDKFQAKGIKFRVLTAKEKGILPARKVGFGAAAGDLIGTIDVDNFDR